jgi:hypothetical protein
MTEDTERISHNDTETQRRVFLGVSVSLWQIDSAFSVCPVPSR